MFDYTPEGVKYNQGEIAVSHLYSINKKLTKLNRKIGILCLLGVVFVAEKHKDQIKNYISQKGE